MPIRIGQMADLVIIKGDLYQLKKEIEGIDPDEIYEKESHLWWELADELDQLEEVIRRKTIQLSFGQSQT